MIIFAKTRGKMPGGCHTPDDHLRSAMIIYERPPMAIYARNPRKGAHRVSYP
jgi:hypothetical protein